MTDPDHFGLFGLARRWDVDRGEVERRYLELSQTSHPDQFVGHGVAAQRAAMERSSRINAAHRTLRDPVLRAEHLVKLGGVDLDSSDPRTGAPHPTQAFLIEMIELRERLAAGDAAGLRDEVEARADAALDAAVAALGRGDVRAAAEQLVARRYFQRFLEEQDA
jgi:molecular chaperone HscB